MNMGKAFTLLSVALCASSAVAGRYGIPVLPPPEHADAEVSTNIPIASLSDSRRFVVDLALNASRTNGVEVAIGSDASPADGTLSAGETAVTVGWRDDHWLLCVPSVTNRIEAIPRQDGVNRELHLRLDIRSNGATRRITMLDGGLSLVPDTITNAIPNAAGWNLVKVTSRGPIASLEALTIRLSPESTEVRFR